VINRYTQINDVESLQRLSFRIYNHGRSPTTELGHSPSRTLASQPFASINSFDLNMTPLAAPATVQPMANGFPRPPPPRPSPARPPSHGKNKKKTRKRKHFSKYFTVLNFKPSPFFEIQEPVSRVLDLPSKCTLTYYLVVVTNFTDSSSLKPKLPHTSSTAGVPPHRPLKE
jgi:hypothetical protein